MTARDLDDRLDDLDPESEPAVAATHSDAYVRTLWAIISRRDDVIDDLREKLDAAERAVVELQAMVNRAHTGSA